MELFANYTGRPPVSPANLLCLSNIQKKHLRLNQIESSNSDNEPPWVSTVLPPVSKENLSTLSSRIYHQKVRSAKILGLQTPAREPLAWPWPNTTKVHIQRLVQL